MNYEHIIFDVKDHVATLTFNRPERLNATIWPMRLEIGDALQKAQADDDIRVLVVTGAGKAFCAGMDVKAKAEGSNQMPVSKRLQGHPVSRGFLALDKPTIAVINGVAVGAGFEMALLCDFRFAAAGVRIGDVHVQRNLVPDLGAPWLLPRIVGWSKACEILLGGDFLTAEEALQMGLVNRVLPPGELMSAAQEYAAKLARNGPLAMKLTKRLMRRAQVTEADDLIHSSQLTVALLMETEEFKDALASVNARRTGSSNQ